MYMIFYKSSVSSTMRIWTKFDGSAHHYPNANEAITKAEELVRSGYAQTCTIMRCSSVAKV